MERLLAIGDIHGCATSFEKLLKEVAITDRDELVILGDFIDRGPDTKKVIEILLEQEAQPNVHLLRGNHEIMMQNALADRANLTPWLGVGGAEVLASYGATTFADIPQDHLDVLNRLLPFHETASHVFVHANAQPDVALADQPDYMLFWEFMDEPQPHISGKTLVCGHTPQEENLPVCHGGHTICLDTGASNGGWLTCMDVLTGRFWQANETGEIRSDILDLIDPLSSPAE